MNREELMHRKLTPELLLQVYSDGAGHYIESHLIDKDGKIMAGRPLTQDTIQGIVDMFYKEQSTATAITGIVPGNLLHYGHSGAGEKMVWYRPEEQRKLYFTERAKLNDGVAWVPATLYIVNGDILRVFALNSNSRPTERSALYRSPYYNVFADGKVCLGNAKVAKPTKRTYQAVMKYWEDIFWLSEFSHLNTDNPTKTPVDKLWQRLLKSKRLKWSQLKELRPMQKKLAQEL